MLTIAVVIFVWAGLAAAAGLADVFEGHRWATAAAPILPTLVLLVAYRFLKGPRTHVAHLEDRALILFQTVRIVGVAFIPYAVLGFLPKWWAFLIGPWDILVGLSAPLVAHRLRGALPSARGWAKAFNLIGLADFALAISLATVAMPGPLRLITVEPSPVALGQFPLTLITAFGLPLATGAHLESLKRLRGAGPR